MSLRIAVRFFLSDHCVMGSSYRNVLSVKKLGEDVYIIETPLSQLLQVKEGFFKISLIQVHKI